MALSLPHAEELVARLGAKVRHINYGCRIIGKNLQHGAGGNRFQPFARLQDGQGAQQANGIEGIGNISHASQI